MITTHAKRHNVCFLQQVQPKAGLALWWSNIRDDLTLDERTLHEAQSVEEGRKLVANLWFHEYNFRKPHHDGCNLEQKVATSATEL